MYTTLHQCYTQLSTPSHAYTCSVVSFLDSIAVSIRSSVCCVVGDCIYIFFFLCMQGRAKWVHQANQGSTEKQVYLCEEKSQITCPRSSNQRVEGSRSEHYRACRKDTRNVYPGHGPRSSCTDTCYWVIKKLINAIVLNPTHYIYEASV